MKDKLMNAYIRGMFAAKSFCAKAKEKLQEERGGSEIIAIIILIVIVVLLAVAFREKIGEFVKNLWGKIEGKESVLGGNFDL